MKSSTPSLLAALALAAAASAQPTALTYQGRLKDGGQPASGLHDFRFRLFNASQGGAQVGDTQCLNNLSVSDGLFTAQIDFGQQYASPDPRFLEIEVRKDTGLGCNNGGGFVVLSPRQPLTAAPRASHANSAFALDAADGGPTGAVFVDAVGNVGIGITAPTARLDVRGGPIVVESVGDQADLFWLASERSWVFRQEGSGSGTALKLESVGGGGNKNFIIDTDGFVGVGTLSPLAKLDVRGDIRLGASGQLRAASGEENLRIIRGTLNKDGTILLGSGFSVARPDNATYDIHFDTPFAATPTVTATVERTGCVRCSLTAMTDGAFADRIRILTFNGLTEDWEDMAFHFIAIGPR